MKSCKKCNISYEDDKKFCKKCGSPLFTEYNIDPKEVAKKAVYEDRLKLDPLNIEILHEFAQFLFNNLLFQESISVSLKILAINESDIIAKELLFKSYLKINKFKETAEIGEQLLIEKPGDISLLENLAKLSIEIKNHDKALEYYDKILSLQPANSSALYNKALILLRKNDIKEAIEIFKVIYNKEQNDRITTIYIGIDKALNADYEASINILTPVLSENNIAKNEIDNNRGFLYLAYSLCMLKVDSKIFRWFSLINIQILKKYFHVLDEQTLAKTISFFVNNKLSIIEQTPDTKEDIDDLVKKYLIPTELYFTKNTSSIVAEIWYNIAIKQKDLGFYEEALITCKKAIDILQDDNRYKDKYKEIKKLLEDNTRKSKRKTKIIIGIISFSILIIIILIITFIKLKESNAWELAKTTNTFSSYQTYQNLYPDGKYIEEANKMQEESLWKEVLSKNTVQSYDNYISLYINGKYIKEVKDKREDVFWEEIKKQNTVGSYDLYLSQYPNGKYIKIFDFKEITANVYGKIKYIGQIKDGKKDGIGIGIIQTNNKDWNGKYIGEWRNDKENGYGIIVWIVGDRYEGGWLNGVFHGDGQYYNNKENKWFFGKFDHGKGKIFTKDGSRYMEWK